MSTFLILVGFFGFLFGVCFFSIFFFLQEETFKEKD